ncbi:MAG: hypothetical protein ACOH18_02585 [Candidatus Saccharimonadaceae bacterium]
MTIDWSDEEQEKAPGSPVVESTPPDEPKAEEAKVITAPIAIIPAPAPIKKTGPFRIYSPHDPDLTDAMRYEIELRMTAGYWLEKALQQENRVEMPAEFRERMILIKLIMQEAAVAFFVSLTAWMLVSNLAGIQMFLDVLGTVLIGLIVGFYFYKLWRITFVVSTATKTGVYRDGVRWMFINKREPELTTTAIIISQPYRHSIFAFIGLNWWRVRLDTAGQDESPSVRRMRFVRNGDRFVRTIEQFQQALR